MSGDLFLSKLVEVTAKGTCQPKTSVRRTINRFLREVQKALADGRPISLHEFGRFDVVSMPPREGHDFSTGARMPVAGRTKVRFSAFARTDRAVRSSKMRLR